MDDPKVVHVLDDHEHGLQVLGGLLLRVVSGLDDRVVELSPLAELHDDVNVPDVLIDTLELDEVVRAAEVPQNVNLPLDVLYVGLGHQLQLRYRLAGAPLVVVLSLG